MIKQFVIEKRREEILLKSLFLILSSTRTLIVWYKEVYIYYKEVTLPQFLQNYKETKTKF